MAQNLLFSYVPFSAALSSESHHSGCRPWWLISISLGAHPVFSFMKGAPMHGEMLHASLLIGLVNMPTFACPLYIRCQLAAMT